MNIILFYRKRMAKETFSNNKLYLILILLFAFIIRIWNIWYPQAYIFDEVYHGFTAQEIAKGNVKAWEWWNSPPKGFSYEWTHPPLAKLIMAGSVLLFNKNNNVSQYAFRFPAVIFGIGVIYLTYLLAVKIFNNERIGLLAAFLISFDGLTFVMSRIGMIDIYCLFFILGTIYLTLNEKYFWSGIFLGLSLASKWTGIYLYPVIGVLVLGKLRRSLPWLNLLLFFGIIPIIVYLFSYTLFFTSGHNWSQFIELQKQMWWYHTNLKATHSYQSKAWSWPLMLRPVWFWVKYQGNKIGNIYNLGNPAIWWGGLLVLPYAFWRAIRQLFLRFKKVRHGEYKDGLLLGFVIFCYFSFWLPWFFSPRVMFLHHYLPAIPFLSILIAYFLNLFWQKKMKNYQLLIISYQLLVIITFFFFFPIYTGMLVPKNLIKYFFWLSSWK